MSKGHSDTLGCETNSVGGSVLRSRAFDAAPLVLLLFAMPASSVGQSPALTATEVMQRVIAATGATPPIGTVDTLKAGDPNTVVTGIATTFMDTYSVLEQAAATGKNLIITHEPTFYNHLDDQSPLAARDPAGCPFAAAPYC